MKSFLCLNDTRYWEVDVSDGDDHEDSDGDDNEEDDDNEDDDDDEEDDDDDVDDDEKIIKGEWVWDIATGGAPRHCNWAMGLFSSPSITLPFFYLPFSLGPSITLPFFIFHFHSAPR